MRRDGQRGLTLAEVLVALTVMTLAGAIALSLYDLSRKSFQKGENATEQQQAVRIAFDEMSSDVRLAGFHANPDGELDSPDDTIEAAFDTAIVLRADYDFEPETLLAGGAHRAVAVGNDEIVAYVLVKPDGPNPDTLVFEADVREEPRDGLPETVRIDGISLVQDDPPYTLYRVTLNEDESKWGGPDFLVRTPLVENIRSLTFRYHAADGRDLNPTFDLTRISDDIGGADAPATRRLRASTRRVEVQIEGLTRDPDLGWQDADDANPATRSYRKFHLRGDVTPRNFAKKGLQDLGWDVTAPSKPADPVLVAGHCLGLWVSWAPNPPEDRVVAYKVRDAAASGPPVFRTIASNAFYLGGLTNGVTYRVSVQALDAANNGSVFSDEVSQVTLDNTSPRAPGTIVPQDLPGRIKLIWPEVTKNTGSNPFGDPDVPKIRDLEGYRIYRDIDTDFPASPAYIVADERLVTPTSSPTFTDLDVVACRDYYYNVLSYDYCDLNNDSGQDAQGRADALAPPVPPIGLTAVRAGSSVRVSWEPTGRDTDGRSAYVDTYRVWRQIVNVDAGELPAACTSPMEFRGTNDDRLQTTFLDDSVPVLPLDQKVVYRLQAKNDCFSNELSACSDPVYLEEGCSFSGEVVIAAPRPGYVVPPVAITVRVELGLDVYTGATLTIVREEDGVTEVVTLPTPGPQWNHTWPQTVAGTYLVKARVDNTDPCSGFAAIRIRVGS